MTTIPNQLATGTGASTHEDGEDSCSAGTDSHNGRFKDNTESATSDEKDSGTNTNVVIKQELADRETKTVGRLRIVMMLLLLFLAILASVLIYRFSHNSEMKEFKNEFESEATKAISGFQDDFLRKLQAMDSLSKSLSAFATNTNATWPYVTVPDTAELFQPYLDMTGAASLAILPFVPSRERATWEEYTVQQQGWIEQALVQRYELEAEAENGKNRELQGLTADINANVKANEMSSFIHNYVGLDTSTGPYPVWWQYAPVISNKYFINFNRMATEGFKSDVESIKNKKAVMSAASTYVPGIDFQSTKDFNFMNQLLVAGGDDNYEPGEPIAYIYYPIFEKIDSDENSPVGILMATVYWKSFFENILSDSVKGVVCVVENNVGQKFTYKIFGSDAVFEGMDDLHDRDYSKYEISAGYKDILNDTERIPYHGVPVDDQHITYSIRVYPSDDLEAEYMTSGPIIYGCVVFLVFCMAVLVFIAYDCFVERRQRIVYTQAIKSTAVVNSLFPENVQRRLMNMNDDVGKTADKRNNQFLNRVDTSFDPSSKPIADLFPDTTILFADMVGFTAWSSSRDPLQVFTLLETIYNAFDEIARRRRVFKVETIGDCYVAVAGLPTPRSDHHIVMCKFAQDILLRLNKLVVELEKTLGPDTSELNLRCGLHSGPVTAGVLRGDKGRFQLFGDTMNYASRMESTGISGKIQISSETARLLLANGKEKWIKEREEGVVAKGKGSVRTFWFHISTESNNNGGQSVASSDQGDSSQMPKVLAPEELEGDNSRPDRTDRLVHWNVEVLLKQLQKVIARRSSGSTSNDSSQGLSLNIDTSAPVLGEVKDVLPLPPFNKADFVNQVDPSSIDIPHKVATQLTAYVARIASMHNSNHFHSFDHASHVTMSVSKLLQRIVEPGSELGAADDTDETAESRHESTFGIVSDPLTQFAVVLSALVHDVDHPGVGNATLTQESHPMAKQYEGKSIAEQNSVNLAFEVLMEPEYRDLLHCICTDQEELSRFRSILVTVVLATDIMDKDLSAMRKARWEKAFSTSTTNGNLSGKDREEDFNRKASIVLEHLIQASDVAHTMQHFVIFKKWNERLFREMYQAYLDGRTEKNPADFWYQGELGFFDFYIIPLAKKLATCGVFGVSSTEYLSYAEANRNEFAETGEQCVKEYLQYFEKKEAKA